MPTPNTDASQEDNLTLQENPDGSAVITTGEEVEERSARADVEGERAEAESSEASELANAKSDEEREAIRERRRQERAAKRARRKEHDEKLMQELAARDRVISQMAQQLNVLTKRSAGTELAQIDNEIGSADAAITELKDIIRQATEEKQGDIVAEATQRMVQLMGRRDNMMNMRRAYVENASRGQEQAQPSAIEMARPQLPPPQMRKLGSEWMRANAWYDPQGRDLDSQLAKQLDNSVMADGYDPTTPEYWEELSDRVRRYLPHVAADVAQGGESRQNGPGTAQRSMQRSVVSGSGKQGGSYAASSGKKTVTLSADRVKALKDAGIWDDPKARNDAIRRYQEYDAQSAQR